MQCPKCQASVNFAPHTSFSRRFRHFSILAAIFFVAGLILQLSGVEAWPWVCYGIGIFVSLQAYIRFGDSRRTYCTSCKHAFSVWPWTRQ